MAKREFLMLAQKYDPQKHRCMGWYASEKLDGVRCFWDGGITRGLRAESVPWANTAKHARFVKEVYATGLWTRYGQPLHAPDWWLDQLPKIPLDGELTCGPKSWQKLSSIIKRREGNERWDHVKYACFDAPSLTNIFKDGQINTGFFKKKLVGAVEWAFSKADKVGLARIHDTVPFYKSNAFLKTALTDLPGPAYWHRQFQIPDSVKEAITFIMDQTKKVEDADGEGLMLRAPVSLWNPVRTYDLLKSKTQHDMEGEVIGYRWAKPTDLERSLTGVETNKLLGLMGSVRIKLDSGVEFDLSGFTDEERRMVKTTGGGGRITGDGTYTSYETYDYDSALVEGKNHSGEVTEFPFFNPNFPRGSRITFKYRELSDSGIPKEARYMRKHEEL